MKSSRQARTINFHNLFSLFQNKMFQDIFFLFFLGLTPLLWFRSGAIMVGHDNVFPLSPQIFLHGRLFTWIDQGFGRSQSLIMGTILIHFFDALPSFFHIPLEIGQMMTYVFWFFMMLLSCYVLAAVLSKDRVFRLVACVFYVFNFFLLQGWFIGERTKFSAYIAMPLILAVFVSVTKRKLTLLQGTCLITLILFIFNAGGLYGVPLYGGMFVTLGTYILFFSIAGIREKRFHRVLRILSLSILTIFCFFLVNAYYILPAMTQLSATLSAGIAKSGGASGLIDWASEISANTSIANLLRLQGIADWYDNPFHPYAKYFLTNPLLIAFSFLFPLLLLLTLTRLKKLENTEFVLYFFFTLLIGIFFAAGTHPPLGIAYEFLISHIPGFSIFRSPYFKFAPAIFLSYSFLIAYFFNSLKGKKKNIFALCFLFILLLYHFPFFTGNFFQWRPGFATRLVIPSYIFSFERWVNDEKKDDSRILMLPENSPNLQYSLYNWGYLSFWALPQLFSNTPIIINNDRVTDEERTLLSYLYDALRREDQTSIHTFASILQIRYILLQRDAYVSDTIPNLVKPIVYETAMQKLLFPLIKRFGKWDVYEIPNIHTSLLFSTSQIHLFNGPIQHITDFTSFTSSDNLFAFSADAITKSAVNIPTDTGLSIPDCLNCIKENREQVVFPDSSILPNSFLYPLVLFNERRHQRNDDVKSLIYNDIGISLKRASEIRIMVGRNIPVKITDIDHYKKTLEKIAGEFMQLSSFADIFQVADDLNYYLSAQQDHLFSMIQTSITNGKDVTDLSELFKSITATKLIVEPFLFHLDTANNRLYTKTIDKAENFSLFLKKDEIHSSVANGAPLHVTIDNTFPITTAADFSTDSPWISFGTVSFSAGFHTFLLSLPVLLNLSRPVVEGIVPYNINKDSTCFVSAITQFVSKNIYKIAVTYPKSFITDLYFYTWRSGENNHALRITQLKTSLTSEKYEEVIRTDEDVTGVHFGICAENLTKDLIENKFNFSVNEIVYPTLMLVPATIVDTKNEGVSFHKINPTRYVISLTSNRPKVILGFASEYDNGWTLSEFSDNHFRLNGFANGWVIDKPGKYTLTLVYKTQNIFLKGVIVSGASVLFSAVLFSYLWYKRREDER